MVSQKVENSQFLDSRQRGNDDNEINIRYDPQRCKEPAKPIPAGLGAGIQNFKTTFYEIVNREINIDTIRSLVKSLREYRSVGFFCIFDKSLADNYYHILYTRNIFSIFSIDMVNRHYVY